MHMTFCFYLANHFFSFLYIPPPYYKKNCEFQANQTSNYKTHTREMGVWRGNHI